MDGLISALKIINTYLSDYILVILLVGCGIFFTVRTGFVQVRCFGAGLKSMIGNFSLHGKKLEKGISPFQALATSVAAQVGTGNIVGVSAAILLGGPGAIFWMWIIAFFGMATIYAEAVLAQETRIIKVSGSAAGGPVYYINRAFKNKWGKILAGVFAVSIIISLGGIGAMVQSNAIGATVNTAFGIPKWVVGTVVALVCGIVFIGGTRHMVAMIEKVIPVIAILYVGGCLAVLVMRIQYIPETFAMIFKYAFAPGAVIGGGFGYALKTAVSQGAKRGLFSNEAGMGSTPHAHAIAKAKKPHDQGVLAMMGVFVDTFVIVTMTALVIISTLYAGSDMTFALSLDSSDMAQAAFSSVFGSTFGNAFVAICLFFFAFSTIIGWHLFARINVEYLFGRKATLVFAMIAVVFIFIGSVLKSDLLWELMDFFSQLMVIPNVPALIALSGIITFSAGMGVKKHKKNKKIEKLEKNK